ncbi:MAG: signal recognition particle-docking protein FtsY, partial [Anaerolineales bacterium]|nr:signal recognition particle-docking protein FtsY [Anaerolineales bacterium]
DTFRAAAIDQHQMLGDRAGVQVISHQPNADPGAVVFDAIKSALARKADMVIIDTAGRLHTKFNLMRELEKLKEIARKQVHAAPHETLLVLDATTGQNALAQAKHFKETVNTTGVVLTKLDGTAKGGMVFAIGKELGVPVRFIGLGEKVEDLMPFDAEAFVNGLFEG